MSRKKRDRVDGYSPKEPAKADPWAEIDRVDGLKNELTGLGDFLRDKRKGNKEGALEWLVTFLTSHECGSRWRGSDLGQRIVETIPDEMTRQGFDVSVQPTDEDEKADAFGFASPAPSPPPAPIEIDDTGTEIAEEVAGILEMLETDAVIKEALNYERAYGGGAIFVGADDGMEDLAMPLNEDAITEVRHLTAFQGGWDGELIAVDWYSDPTKPKYGQPSLYRMRAIGMPGATAAIKSTQNIHESRLLVFPGQAVSREARSQLRGWGDSVFTRIDEVLSDYSQTWGGVANLMTDFSQGILKVGGLLQSMAGNNKNGSKLLTQRALTMNMTRSISRVLMVDAEKEDFRRETASLSGLPELLQQFALRLSAAADMPVSLLMGQAPAGLNATGASDIRFFYDRVASKQRNRLLPQLKKLIRLIFKSANGPTSGKEPARWDVRFRSLYQMSDTEKAEVRWKVAQTDGIYIDKGVLTPEEVAASTFGGSEWSMDRTIDFAGREEMARQHEKDMTEHEKQVAAQAKAKPVLEDE